ncbi:MAG: LysR family transcriptional regulator [Polaromonas sp.]|uniref:LysR substrate-binding domain-containing protein n=1 Tax=Polaromonas sp. TaxID=1869339 RepID=UPI001820E59E|nr:LysR substrate-binding domain-containing protein [Polaromonas sp.]MBA3595427.1 LysR family transcriptional regulator [Polaromonas sp.]
MLDLNDFYYFVQVVENKGFAAAGRALGLPKSTLSRRIIALETRLGARLIHRTSRRFAMSEAGQEFHQHAVAMLIEAEAAENAVRHRVAEPGGTIRFTCSIGMAQPLAALLCRFLVMFPKVNLVQHATNRHVDLVEEGFDVGLRGHFKPLPDSSLIQRKLASTPWHLFASPAYLKRVGAPQTPSELTAHPGLTLGIRDAETSWTLRNSGGAEVVVPFAARIRSEDLETLRQAAVAGMGIVAFPPYLCRMETDQGSLQAVLPGWTAWSDAGVSLLAPSRRGQLPSVRAFIDFMVTEYPPLVAGSSALP